MEDDRRMVRLQKVVRFDPVWCHIDDLCYFPCCCAFNVEYVNVIINSLLIEVDIDGCVIQ